MSEGSERDPVVAWSNGGPGASSIQWGLYSEVGAALVRGDELAVNPHAWNRIAHMLFLEAPGSGGGAGFSSCRRNASAVPCVWSDSTQAVAFAHALWAFFRGFPELQANELFLAGESYFGQMGPAVAHYVLHTPPSRRAAGQAERSC